MASTMRGYTESYPGSYASTEGRISGGYGYQNGSGYAYGNQSVPGYGRYPGYGGCVTNYGQGYYPAYPGPTGNRQMEQHCPPGHPSPQTGVVDHMFSVIGGIQYITDIFTHLSALLNANADALHASFSSVIGLIEGLGHLGHILSGFTALSMLKKMFNWLLGRKSLPAGNALANEFKTTSRRSSRWPVVLALLGLAAITTPFFCCVFSEGPSCTNQRTRS